MHLTDRCIPCLILWINSLMSISQAEINSGYSRPEECATDSQQSELNSFLWRLERDPPSYFFGTIHVPYTRVWDYIPQSTKNAFRFSDNVYFELDLTDHMTASALANCQMLPGGQTLSDILPKRLYKRLNRHMDYIRRKIPDWMGEDQRSRGDYYVEYQYRAIVGSWQRMKPVWLTLLLNSLTENDIKLFGVPVLDLYLSRQAVQWHKNIGAIERVDEQCAPLNKLNNSRVMFALDQTLRQQERRRSTSESMPDNDDLITHYNCGDLKSVLFKKDTLKVNLSALEPKESELSSMAKEMDEYFQTELLFKRNEIMAERIERILNDNPRQSFFFAFGAGHFLGNNSVIDKLVKAGFEVKHTKPDSLIQSHSKRDSMSNSEPFIHMDSSSLYLNSPYMKAMRKLEQPNSGRSTRHGHGRNRERNKPSKDRNVDSNNSGKPKQSISFTKLWIKVEEISSVTDSPYYRKAATPSAPKSSSVSSVYTHESHFICIINLLLLLLHHIQSYTQMTQLPVT